MMMMVMMLRKRMMRIITYSHGDVQYVDEDSDGGNVDGHKQGDGELTKLAP